MALPFFVTPLYAALCGLLLMVLSVRVILLRRELKVGLGDGDQPVLRRAIRVQANGAEYVPLALILLLLLEISHQVPAVALHGLRSEEHTSELQSLMRPSYAVFCLTQKQTTPRKT